jgi:hypothetical protein
MKWQQILVFLGLAVTFACFACLLLSFWGDHLDMGPEGAYLGEVWVKDGTRLEVHSGILHQEGDGGVAIRHSRVGSIRAVLGIDLALVSATGWLLLLRKKDAPIASSDQPR